MSATRRPALLGAATAAALTLIALVLLDVLVQQQLGTNLATVGLATRAGPGVVSLSELGMSGAAVDAAHAQARWAWQYGGALVIGLGTAGVLLNGVGARMAAWIEARVPAATGWRRAAR